MTHPVYCRAQHAVPGGVGAPEIRDSGPGLAQSVNLVTFLKIEGGGRNCKVKYNDNNNLSDW